MQPKDLTPRYAALASAIEAKLGARVERLPTTTAELGYRVVPEQLLEVCRTLRDEPELKFEMLIDVCAEFGVATERVEGRSGAWVRATDGGPDRKIAQIGIRVSRGATLHGFALNCDCDLANFDRFIPCGIRDAGVTSRVGCTRRPSPARRDTRRTAAGTACPPR